MRDFFPNNDNLTRHALIEDAMALVTGTMLVALGVVFFKQAHLATGGVTGLAFLVSYAAGWPLGAVLFVLNLPFYIFAWTALGRDFTIKTFASVSLLSVETSLFPHLLQLSDISPVFAAVLGGLCVGVGLLVLARHRASLGGTGVMAIWCQDKLGWRAGYVQMATDVVITVLALFIMSPFQVVLSIVSVVVLNLVLAINHRPGRYMAM